MGACAAVEEEFDEHGMDRMGRTRRQVEAIRWADRVSEEARAKCEEEFRRRREEKSMRGAAVDDLGRAGEDREEIQEAHSEDGEGESSRAAAAEGDVPAGPGVRDDARDDDDGPIFTMIGDDMHIPDRLTFMSEIKRGPHH